MPHRREAADPVAIDPATLPRTYSAVRVASGSATFGVRISVAAAARTNAPNPSGVSINHDLEVGQLRDEPPRMALGFRFVVDERRRFQGR